MIEEEFSHLGWRVAAILLWMILLTLLLTGCQLNISPEYRAQYQQRFDTMAVLAQLPMPPPTIVYKGLGPKTAGLTDCNTRTISIDYHVAATQPDFVIDKVIPHEFAHIVSCYYRGKTTDKYGNPHDDFWRQWVVRLDGDPEYI